MPDFLPERDAILLTFSRNFAQRLSAAPGDFGVTPLDAAQYQSLTDAYALTYRTAYAPATNSTTAVAAKNSARRLLKQDTRRLTRIVRAAGVTDAQLIQLGLRAPRPRRKRIALREARGLARAARDLQRAIAVALEALHLSDPIRQRLDHRHRHRGAVVGEYSGHAALAAYHTNGHFLDPHRAGRDRRYRLCTSVCRMRARTRNSVPHRPANRLPHAAPSRGPGAGNPGRKEPESITASWLSSI